MSAYLVSPSACSHIHSIPRLQGFCSLNPNLKVSSPHLVIIKTASMILVRSLHSSSHNSSYEQTYCPTFPVANGPTAGTPPWELFASCGDLSLFAARPKDPHRNFTHPSNRTLQTLLFLLCVPALTRLGSFFLSFLVPVILCEARSVAYCFRQKCPSFCARYAWPGCICVSFRRSLAVILFICNVFSTGSMYVSFSVFFQLSLSRF